MSHRSIYTIGHGNRTVEDLIRLLQQHRIAYLIDVRSQPYSRYQPEFSQKDLESHLNAHGIRYVFMGDSLGGRPDAPECYTDGKVNYELLREQDFYQAGLERLENAWRQDLGVMLLCSEQKPENCHRSKLIGRSLVTRGIPVAHIDENDALLSQQDVRLRVIGGQPSLFGEDFHEFASRKQYKPISDSKEDTPSREPEDDP